MQAIGLKNRISLHSIDGSNLKIRGSLSFGTGGHFRKSAEGSLSFGISIYYSKAIYIIYLKYYYKLRLLGKMNLRRDSPAKEILIEEWTIRSMMASATVCSPMDSCQ